MLRVTLPSGDAPGTPSGNGAAGAATLTAAREAAAAPRADFLATEEPLGIRVDGSALTMTIGWALLNGRLPLSGCALLVSGRASFELVQKAALAGIPLLAAVSAPSSLAAELAESAGLTLVGFLRGQSMNVYTAQHRLTGA